MPQHACLGRLLGGAWQCMERRLPQLRSALGHSPVVALATSWESCVHLQHRVLAVQDSADGRALGYHARFLAVYMS
eukprot:scaffold1711_cov258-Prasinococcus_capsulatus_cf.AAC.5